MGDDLRRNMAAAPAPSMMTVTPMPSMTMKRPAVVSRRLSVQGFGVVGVGGNARSWPGLGWEGKNA
jgi:hypothetical protein